MQPVRRCSRQDRTSALILFRASLLIAGRKLLKFLPCLSRALRCRNVKPRKVNAVCSYEPRRFPSCLADAVHHRASRRGESHPPALSEPCLNLSAYTAPIVQPPGLRPKRQCANSRGDRREAPAINSPARFSRRRNRLYLRMAQRNVRLLGSHLTHHVRLFRNAHHPGSFTDAACGGLRPPPAWAVPEGLPPSPVQHRIQSIPSTSEPPSAFLAHRHPRNARTQRPDIPGPSTNRKHSAGTD